MKEARTQVFLYFGAIMNSLREIYHQSKEWLHRNGFLPGKTKEAWSPHDATGSVGEDLAAEHLVGLGYQILERNFKRTWGEIDIIALDQKTVVYVEVKARKSRTAKPEQAVNKAKREQMVRVAKSFAAQHKLLHQPSRFDIVAVCAPESDSPDLVHFKNAFRNDSPDAAFTRYH